MLKVSVVLHLSGYSGKSIKIVHTTDVVQGCRCQLFLAPQYSTILYQLLDLVLQDNDKMSSVSSLLKIMFFTLLTCPWDVFYVFQDISWAKCCGWRFLLWICRATELVSEGQGQTVCSTWKIGGNIPDYLLGRAAQIVCMKNEKLKKWGACTSYEKKLARGKTLNPTLSPNMFIGVRDCTEKCFTLNEKQV